MGYVRGLSYSINTGMRLRTSIGKGIKGFRLMDGAGGETIMSLAESDKDNMIDTNISNMLNLVSDITNNIVFQSDASPNCFNDNSYKFIKSYANFIAYDMRKNNMIVITDKMKYYQKWDYIVAEIFNAMMNKYGYNEKKKALLFMIDRFQSLYLYNKYYSFLKNMVDIFKGKTSKNPMTEYISDITKSIDEIEHVNQEFKTFFSIHKKEFYISETRKEMNKNTKEDKYIYSPSYIGYCLGYFFDVFINEKGNYKFELTPNDIQKIIYSKNKHETTVFVLVEKWKRKFSKIDYEYTLNCLETMVQVKKNDEEFPEKDLILRKISNIKAQDMVVAKPNKKKKK